MTDLDRDLLLIERKGALESCNLWDFWDGISVDDQNGILEYFENTPMFFDYTTLFKTNSQIDLYHGVINVMGTLFVRKNLSLADYFFAKFLEYTPLNYHLSSNWGLNWNNAKIEMIKIWEIIVNNSDESDVNSKLRNLENVKSISIEDIYWVDAHFFVQSYSEVVYKCYLNNECAIDRFEKAFNFCYNNVDRIKSAITKVFGWEKPLRNSIIEQFLIYLEREKQFDRCIDIIKVMKEKGWRNDFEKRLKRCVKKNLSDDKSK